MPATRWRSVRSGRRAGAGLSVPGDVSVVGYDDSAFMNCTDPPLTTVRQPIEAIGRAAVAMLAGRSRGPRSRRRALLRARDRRPRLNGERADQSARRLRRPASGDTRPDHPQGRLLSRVPAFRPIPVPARSSAATTTRPDDLGSRAAPNSLPGSADRRLARRRTLDPRSAPDCSQVRGHRSVPAAQGLREARRPFAERAQPRPAQRSGVSGVRAVDRGHSGVSAPGGGPERTARASSFSISCRSHCSPSERWIRSAALARSASRSRSAR